MKLMRAGLLGAAIAAARSPQGQQMIAQARAKFDTPQNRAKAQHALEQLKARAATR